MQETYTKREARKGRTWVAGMTLAAVLAAGAGVSSVQAAPITNADIAKNAGISYGKLKLAGKIDGDDIKGGSIKAKHIAKGAVRTNEILDGTIANADINAAAAIAGTKISPNFGAQNVVTTGTLGAGATTLSSTLAVTGATTLTGALSANGNVTLGDAAADVLTFSGTVAGANALAFEGATTNGFQTTLAVADPTADHTITLPNVTGTVVTTGDTGSVTSGMILNGEITNADINAAAAIDYSKLSLSNSIDTGDIAADTIDTDDIAVGGVATAEILDGTILSEDIAVDAITTVEIDDGTITGGDLASNIAITTSGAIAANGGITTDGGDSLGASGNRWSTIYADTLNYASALTDANAGNTTVTMGGDTTNDTVNISANTTITDAQWSVSNAGAAAFASATVGGSNVVTVGDTGTVTTGMIANGTIANADVDAAAAIAYSKLALANSIVTGDIVDGTIAAADLGNDSVDSAEIANNAVTSSEIANDAVDSAEIANNAVTTSEIAANTIVGGDLATDIALSTSGNLTVTGLVDFSGTTGDVNFGAKTITTTGVVNADGGFTSNGETGITDASVTADTACVLEITGGLITGQTGC
jgi:hypothetical protein